MIGAAGDLMDMLLNNNTHRDLNATLSPCPKSLHILWMEYLHGIGGRKPAKDFTSEERGKQKHKYCLRKPFWDLTKHMINHGLSAQVAVDKIYNVYGNLGSVTKILRKIKRDKQNGGHPELQF